MAKGGRYPGPRGGMGGGGNMQQMMRQMQKVQQEMEKKQAELETRSFEASTGGGMVKAVVNGKQEVLEIAINPEVVDPQDVEMLQDMIISAVNEALRAAAEASNSEMNALAGGAMPGGLF